MVVKRQPSASPPKSAEIQYELVHSADQSDTKTPEEAFQQGHDNGAIPMDYGQQTYSDLPAVSQQDHIVHFDGGLDQYDSLLNDTHVSKHPPTTSLRANNTRLFKAVSVSRSSRFHEPGSWLRE